MVRADVCYLITEEPKAHGIFDAPAEITRKVYCTVKSIGQNEVYEAAAVGLKPEYKLVLAHEFEYGQEKELMFHGKRYRVLRTYMNEADGIELTIQPMDGNAVERVSPVVL